ncbi:unnamed protein product [Adineta ricciae]|uniref:Extradiol ring-cleavage dioxygenase class III enzyme subunit B domain-containing protein n=1 Tax=Adineta ricciae TaxID=249248 RepID=A0A814Y0T2_ADIRI|nr:unnamed protein product [Adineta ricciae]CAF1273699.1 unnamed protein product [Adineta ricciae]
MENLVNTDHGLVGIAYLPHGTMTLDPNREDLPHGADDLHRACTRISEKIAQLNPDLIILLTPHGINLHQSLNIYQPGTSSCTASGNAEWNDQWNDFSVNVHLDGEASQHLFSYLKQHMVKVEGMLSFGGLSTPLRWGEVVPLYFALHQIVSNANGTTTSLKQISVPSSPKVVIIAQPAKGSTMEEREYFMVEQRSKLVEFGRLLRSWCDQSSHRILLLISGDQAHTHAWSPQLATIYQPDPSCFSKFPQAGTEEARSFDKIVEDWMTGRRSNSNNDLYSLDKKLIVDEAGPIERFALSCGYVGSLTLQGVLENQTIQNRVADSSGKANSSADWLLTDFISACPTYYGMMAALFVRTNIE